MIDMSDMDIQEKVVFAVQEMENGSPLKDFLTDSKIEDALSMFADVLVTLGIRHHNDDEES